MNGSPMYTPSIWRVAALLVFTATVGLADAWLVAWSIGSVWGTAAAAGCLGNHEMAACARLACQVQRSNDSGMLLLQPIKVLDGQAGMGRTDADALRLQVAPRLFTDSHPPEVSGTHH